MQCSQPIHVRMTYVTMSPILASLLYIIMHPIYTHTYIYTSVIHTHVYLQINMHERAWPASGAAWCHVTHAAVPVLYLILYVELSPGLSQQSHHIHFAFISCQVKSCIAILYTEIQSAHPVQLYIVTLCVIV